VTLYAFISEAAGRIDPSQEKGRSMKKYARQEKNSRLFTYGVEKEKDPGIQC